MAITTKVITNDVRKEFEASITEIYNSYDVINISHSVMNKHFTALIIYKDKSNDSNTKRRPNTRTKRSPANPS